MDLERLRSDYTRGGLRREDLAVDPFEQFRRWFDEAMKAELPEPNAMTLATSGATGMPSVRIVLLKGVDDEGFVFYTNYESRKGRELAANPQASLLFFWAELQRQVRIEGSVEKVSREATEQYFATRPRGSRLGAWASPQSRPVADRAELETAMHNVEERFGDGDVPAPPHWGGYLLRPRLLEFWQGRPNRLHDRLCYRRRDDVWTVERLAP
ncbi:MAG: pyridoxamine 5'-phosphate oxidase [Acidobacteria bacterium]|nr:pyridoxamine 5'-phosphate oxidase [Acidobacteriota bacterium]